ncbi:hypothetical protein N8I74_18970 [Chitiniphilus purpureus]|uniref:Uncharacterized protein n=1 Tax=Chitiniphilus purpureus TaxID=2981137 RepID=A0ABY6DLW6_9NEIS|nr:hypothetical protein [Chitiniphilus sp. CD1]UXY15365.1 hypothetical protein N8I74_18970 [Chitiniphilus sp. CD1]
MLYCTFTLDEDPSRPYLSAWGGRHRANRGHVAIYDQSSGDIVARYELDAQRNGQRELELIHRRAIAQFYRDRRSTPTDRYMDLDPKVRPWPGEIIHL